MFIVWGEYDSDRERGVVADKCPNCSHMTTLRVIQRYRTSHVYFIPLGSGKLIGTILVCSECGEKAAGAMESYAQVLPKKEAKGLSIGEVLQQTNPRLAEALAYRARLEQEAREARSAVPGAPDPRVTLAFARLADLNPQDPHVLDFQSRLAQWSALDAAAQSKLLRDVEALVSEYELHEETIRFLRVMGNRFRPLVNAGLGLGVLTFLGAAGLGIPVMVYLLQEDGPRAIGTLVALLAATVFAAVVGWRYRQRAHRRFFQSTFVSEADSQGVGVARAVALLQGVDPSNQQITRGVRGLAKGLPLLKEVLEEEGRLEEEKWGRESN